MMDPATLLLSPQVLTYAGLIFVRLMGLLIVFSVGRAFIAIALNNAIQMCAIACISMAISMCMSAAEDQRIRELADQVLGGQWKWLTWIQYLVG